LLIVVGVAIEARAGRRKDEIDDEGQAWVADTGGSYVYMADDSSVSQASPVLKLMLMVLPVGMIVIGAALLVSMFVWWYEYHDSADWPAAQGYITTSRVEQTLSSSENDMYDYIVELEYAYVVDGQTYTNDRIYFSLSAFLGDSGHNKYDTRSEAYRVADKYPAGAQVAVLYNPNKPAEAILERRIDTVFLVIGVGGGGVLALLGAGATLVGIWQIIRG
jgi:hypothetical protein